VRINLKAEEVTYQMTAESDMHMYALYTEGANERAGEGSGTRQEEAGDGAMEEASEPESEEADEAETHQVGDREAGGAPVLEDEVPEAREQTGGSESVGRKVGEAQAQGQDTEVSAEAEGSASREGGESGELEEREGWPAWLKSTIDMLEEGEIGKELKTILIKLIKIEMYLGFKEEKTVSNKHIYT
jgi:hypothetical protein